MQEKKPNKLEQAAQFELLISEIKQLSREIHQPFARFLCLYALTPTAFKLLFGGTQPENSLLGPTLIQTVEYLMKMPIAGNLFTSFGKRGVGLFNKAIELQLTENMKTWFGFIKQGRFQEACEWLMSYPKHEAEINNQVRALWQSFFDAKNWDSKAISENCQKLEKALGNPKQLKKELLPLMQNSQSLGDMPEKFGAALGAFFFEVIASAYLTGKLADKILNTYLHRNPLGWTRLKPKQDTLDLLKIDSVNPNQLKIYQPAIEELKTLKTALKQQKSKIRKAEWLFMAIGFYFFYSTDKALNPYSWSFLLMMALISNTIPNVYSDFSEWRQNSNFDRHMKTFTEALGLLCQDLNLNLTEKTSSYNEFEKTFVISLKGKDNRKLKILLRELLVNGIDVKYSTAKSICFTSKVILTKSQAEKILKTVNHKFHQYEKINQAHKEIIKDFGRFAHHFGLGYDYHKITDKSGGVVAYRYQLKVSHELLGEVKTQLTQIFNILQLEIADEKDFSILSFSMNKIQNSGALKKLLENKQEEPIIISSPNPLSPKPKKSLKGNQFESNTEASSKEKLKLPPKLVDFGKHGKFDSKKSSEIKPLQSQFFPQKKSGNLYVKFTVDQTEFANQSEFKSFGEVFERSGGAKLVPHKGNEGGVKGIVRNYDWVRNKEGKWVQPAFKVKDSVKDGRIYASEVVKKGEDTLYVFDTYISNTH